MTNGWLEIIKFKKYEQQQLPVIELNPPKREIPRQVKPVQGKPILGNPAQLNIDIIKERKELRARVRSVALIINFSYRPTHVSKFFGSDLLQ